MARLQLLAAVIVIPVSAAAQVPLLPQAPLVPGATRIQANEIAGLVFDPRLGVVLARAAIRISGRQEVVVADSVGRFRIAGLAPGRYEMKISFIGYHRATVVAQIDTNAGAFVLAPMVCSQMVCPDSVVLKEPPN